MTIVSLLRPFLSSGKGLFIYGGEPVAIFGSHRLAILENSVRIYLELPFAPLPTTQGFRGQWNYYIEGTVLRASRRDKR